MKERIASVLIGAAITAVALWFLITPEVLQEARTVAAAANWWMLAAAVLINPVVQWLRAWRFGMMTHGTLAFPDAQLVRIAFQLNFLNFALPFRLGELGYPVLMQRAFGEPLFRSAGVLVLARLFDLCTVGATLVGAAALLGLAATPRLSLAFWGLALALGVGPVGLVLGGRAAGTMLRRLRPGQAGTTPNGIATSPSAYSAQFVAIGVSFLIWFVFGGMATLTAAAVGDAVSPAVALLGASAGNLAFALPINGIGGLGPSQAAFVAAVTRVGVPWNEAVIAALALYLVTLGGAVLFGGTAMTSGAGVRSS